MAAKFDAAMLKKHHFWFLLAFVFIGLVLAWVGLFWDVPDAVLATKEDQEKRQQGLKSVQAKPRSLIAKYADQVLELQKVRVAMWKQAWDEQKDLYFWPARQQTSDNNPFNILSPERAFFLDQPSFGFSEKQLEVVANRKFGEDIPNRQGVRDQFRNPEIYEAAYRRIVADVWPMQFRDNNWETVLSHVGLWGQMPTSEEVWLAMEDMWVQREILTRIHQVNVDAAKFASTSDLAGAVGGMAAGLQVEDPFKRVFRSRIWQLDLQLVEEGNKRKLRGSLKNLTNRLQVLGIGNVLRLKVWTTDPNNGKWYPLEIEGVSVPSGIVEGKNPLPIKPTASHEIPTDWPVRGLFKVEQVFDTRTIPVKRIEHLVIGKLSDRNNSLLMRMSAFSEAVARKEPAANTGVVGPMGGTAPVGPMEGGGEGATATAVTLSGETPQHRLNRARYIDVTDQLRRIPIGLVVVTDQSYMKDILESIANTKMRFQTTQVEWSRYHNVLNYQLNPTGPVFGGGLGGERGSPEGPIFGSGFQQGYTGGPENSSQDQFSANLMELSVYGIISLYEKYDDPKGTPRQPSSSKTKAPPAVKEKEDQPVGPKPKEKMPPEKKNKEAAVPMPKNENDPKKVDPKSKSEVDPKKADPKLKM